MTRKTRRMRFGRCYEQMLFAVFIACATAPVLAQNAIKLTIPAHDRNRRFITPWHLVSADGLTPPFLLRDAETEKPVPCQVVKAGQDAYVGWMVPFLEAGKSRTFVLSQGQSPETDAGVSVREDPGGFLSIRAGASEITRYCFGPQFAKFKKPFFYPVMVQGVSITRAFPMEDKAGEDRDHPHHTGVWFTHGEVNGRDYWAKLPITHKRIINTYSGPVVGGIVAENAWGEDLLETQDIGVYSVGQDVIMDWVITLKADKADVHLGKTKEGGMAVRVATGITAPEANRQTQTGRGQGKMVDADGNQGEPAIRDDKRQRKQSAVWADDYGKVNGKTVGVAIMNHPTSWRHPTDWHVRNYGLFAANAFFLQGEHTLKKGESITLKYRLYFHGGDPTEAKVSEVYAGYANAKVVAQ